MFKKYNTSKTIIIFAPFIEKGGIEKNLFLFANFLVKTVDNLVLITWKKGDKKYFNKKIKIVNPSLFYQKIKNRNFKNIISLMILIKLIPIRSNSNNLYQTHMGLDYTHHQKHL